MIRKFTFLLFCAIAGVTAMARDAADQVCMTDGDHGTVTLSAPVGFYDDGGPEGPIGENVNASVTFVPASEGDLIKLTFHTFGISYSDRVKVYNGRTADTDALIGEYKGSTLPAPVISGAEDGSLTVVYTTGSSHYSSYDGWSATVEPYRLKDLELASIAVTPACAPQIVRGATDAPLLCVDLNIEGDRASTSVSSISGKVAGGTATSGITSVKAWYTGVYHGFSPADCLGSATVSDGRFDIEFDSPVNFDKYGHYYIYVTADISGDLEAGSAVGLGDVTVTSSDRAVAEAEPTVATAGIRTGFAGGTYTIGGENADYASFGEAVAAMGDAVEGDVTFMVRPGTYAEDIVISNISGTSHTRGIRFVADGEGVEIPGAGYTSNPTDYNSPKTPVFAIENTSHVTLEGLTFNPSTPYPRVVYLGGASRYFTMRGCDVSAELWMETRGNSRYMVYTEAEPQVAGANADHITIEGNTLTGGYIALYVEGSKGYPAYGPLNGAVIRNNTFVDNGAKAVYVYQVNDAVISGNRIMTSDKITKSDYMGIDLRRLTGTVDVCYNNIAITQGVQSQGLNIAYDCKGTTRPIRIYNNAIAISNAPTTGTYGIKVSTDSYVMDLVHNSVHVKGAAARAIGFVSKSYPDFAHIVLKNNLLQNSADAGEAFYLDNDAKIGEFALGGNVLYAESGTLSNLAPTLTDWTSLTGDTPVEEQAAFMTVTDLHLTEAGSLQCAVPVDYITDDIDGALRPAVATAGAYEFAPVVPETPVIAEGYPLVEDVVTDGFGVRTKWSISGTVYAMVSAAADEAPDANRLETSGRRYDATAGTDMTVSFDGLADNTAYRAYVMMVSPLGMRSEISVAEATTLRYIAPLTVVIDPEVYEEDVDYETGETLTVYPEISGGDLPYTYSWTDRAGNEVGTDEAIVYTLTGPEVFTLTVTSADGQTASAYTLTTVYGADGDADFEDNPLAPESAWCGYEDREYANFPWFSGAFAFDNMYWAQYYSWSGFAYSNSTSAGFGTLDDQFNNVTGGARSGNGYAVSFLWSPMRIHILKDRDGAELDHMYVTNASYTYSSIINGDGFAKPFEKGDYFKVVFTGDAEDGEPVEVYLADYRSDNEAEHHVVSDWELVDLSPLGKVRSVAVSIESSNMNTPSYFAFDDIAYKKADGIGDTGFDPESAPVSVRYITPDGRVAADSADALAPGIYIVEYTMEDGSVKVDKIIVK